MKKYVRRVARALHEQMPGCTHDEHGADCMALAEVAVNALKPELQRSVGSGGGRGSDMNAQTISTQLANAGEYSSAGHLVQEDGGGWVVRYTGRWEDEEVMLGRYTLTLITLGYSVALDVDLDAEHRELLRVTAGE